MAFLAPEQAGNEALAIRRGVTAGVVVFGVYCSIQLRDSLLLRPHPIIWRLVHGAGIVYLVLLVYLLCFPPEQGRRLLQVWFPDLSSRVGPAENEAAYATDCRIWTPGDPGGPFARVKENLVDIFVIAHAVGWWGKAVLLRDWRLAWALSVLWELLEMSLQKILPNFHECWWDHWGSDFLLANGGGLWLGMKTVEYWHLRGFDWTGRQAVHPLAKDPLRQLGGLLRQFTPYEFTRYEWGLFSSFKHFFGVVVLVLVMVRGGWRLWRGR
jgi:phosphatidylserine synthase 2